MTNLCCKEHDVFWQYSTSEFSHCSRNKGSKVVETKMSNVRETRASLVYATPNKFINKQLNLLFYTMFANQQIQNFHPGTSKNFI